MLNRKFFIFGNKGFTLLELMAVVLIISIGLVGVMNLIFQISLQARLIRSKLIAAYLVQEGIEIVRNIRDANFINALAWDYNIDEGQFGIDYMTCSSLPPVTCFSPDPNCGDGSAFLKYSGGFYNCATGIDTKFKRRVIIQKLIEPITFKPTISVLVVVSWEEAQKNYEVRAEEVLRNWRD